MFYLYTLPQSDNEPSKKRFNGFQKSILKLGHFHRFRVLCMQDTIVKPVYLFMSFYNLFYDFYTKQNSRKKLVQSLPNLCSIMFRFKFCSGCLQFFVEARHNANMIYIWLFLLQRKTAQNGFQFSTNQSWFCAPPIRTLVGGAQNLL